MTKVGEQAVVIGAGMGGLAAAAAVAPFFEKVIVLDRDALPSEAAWRIGTPQSRHPHALLAGGLQALEDLAPGLAQDLVAAGAVAVNFPADIHYDQPGHDPLPRRDLGLPPAYFMTRPLLEFTLRRRVERFDNVDVRPRHKVKELSTTANRVTGVVVDAGAGAFLIPTDLVVDSSGRGAPTLAVLAALGFPPPPWRVDAGS